MFTRGALVLQSQDKAQDTVLPDDSSSREGGDREGGGANSTVSSVDLFSGAITYPELGPGNTVLSSDLVLDTSCLGGH